MSESSFGTNLSKVFDTVAIDGLLKILGRRNVDERNKNMIDMLLSDTQPTTKQSKKCGTILATVIGVPQGDGLSPRIFIL